MRLTTTAHTAAQAQRVEVDEDLVDGPYDYADAFEVRVAEPDARTAEEWLRSGLEGAPGALRGVIVFAHRFVLGLRLGPRTSPDHILGWRIEENRPELTRLGASSPFMRGVIVAQRLDPTRARLTTFGLYTRPVPGRLIWAVAGPLHRRVAPYLMERAVIGRT
jgi:hypothetical protein